MEKMIAEMKSIMKDITADIDKGNKASEARVRKGTLALEKLGKVYRKKSISLRK